MEPIEIPDTRWDFYDPSCTPLGAFKLLGGALCLFSLLFTSFWWAHPYSKIQVISCFLCPLLLLSLPRLTRSAFLAYQGAPIICFNEQGFWARHYSHFGWINWRDVTSVTITADYTGVRHGIEVHLSDKELFYPTFSERVGVMLIKELLRFLQISDGIREKTLQITNASELTCSGADFITTINRVLSNAHVPCTWKQTFPAS
jgi:hypothetical protein